MSHRRESHGSMQLLDTIQDYSPKRSVMPGNAARTTACRCTLSSESSLYQTTGKQLVASSYGVLELLERSAGAYHGISTYALPTP